MRPPRFLAVVPMFAVAVAAQDPKPVDARTFLPEGRDTVLFADLASMRTSGVWEDIEVSGLKVVLPQLEKELGFPLARLDRATMVVFPNGDEDGPKRLVMFEGNGELPIPDRVARGAYDEGTLGAHVVYRNRFHTSSWFVRPRADLQVMGHEEFVAPVLRGERGPGAPTADVMSLMSRRGDSAFYLLVGLQDARARAETLGQLFPDTQWLAEDAPTHLLLRGRTIGDPDDLHAEVELVIRHRTEGEGLAVSEGAVDGLIERLRKEPALASLRSLWRSVEKRRDHSDLCVAVDIGRTRDAVGKVAMLAAAFWLQPVQAVQARAAAAPVPVPDPDPPKKQ